MSPLFNFRHTGFINQPTDHYLNTFYRGVNKYGTRTGRKVLKTFAKWAGRRALCYGETPPHMVCTRIIVGLLCSEIIDTLLMLFR